MTVSVNERDGKWILSMEPPNSLLSFFCEEVTHERLGTPIFTEEPFENPDGTPIDFTSDYLTEHRTDKLIPGPFANLPVGKQEIVVWENN